MISPIIIASIGYIIGIIMELYFKKYMFHFFIFIIFDTICIIYFINKKHKSKKQMNLIKYFKIILNSNYKILIIFIIMFLFGIMKINISELHYNKSINTIKNQLDTKNRISLKGIIESDNKENEFYYIYTLNIDNKYKCILKQKRKDNTDIKYKYGDYISLNGTVEFPQSQRNYKGYNYKEDLKNQKIYFIIKTESNSIKLIKSNKKNLILLEINNLRNYLIYRMDNILNTDEAHMLQALLIGEKNNLDNEIKDDFTKANLSHVLAVSGMHVSYIILMCNICVSKIPISKTKEKIIIIFILIIYIFLTNNSPSVVRACIMGIMILIADIAKEKSNTYINLCVSSLIILIINPYCIRENGFMLSYFGTLGILLFYKKSTKSYIKQLLLVSFAANILIMPILWYQNFQISFIFLISCVITSPILSIIMIYGICSVAISVINIAIAKFISLPLNFCIQLLIKSAYICSKIEFLNIKTIKPSLTCIIIYYFIIFLYYIYQRYKKSNRYFIKKIINYIHKKLKFKNIIKIISVILIFIFTLEFIFKIENMKNKKLKIYFIDVGQGDSSLLKTYKNTTILIDSGGSKENSYDIGKLILYPYLKARKINKLDYVLITHFDADHCNGLNYLLDNMKIKNLIISKQSKITNEYNKIINKCNKKKVKIRYVKEKDIMYIDDLKIDILHPQEELLQDDDGGINSNSIVCKITYKEINEIKILCTGDAEKETEKILINKYKDNNELKADILKVGHHGSKTSSIKEFLDLVKPDIALIGVGEKNTFGHPNKNVIKRLENIKCKVYRTDLNGEIEIEINKYGKIKSKSKF